MIAINDGYRFAPWADVLFACDAKWWRWHKGVPDFPGLKYALQPAAAVWPGVQILRNTGDRGIETSPTGVRNGRCGGYQAVNVAVHMGASRIVLLGYDMGYEHEKQSHWFGQHPDRQVSPYEVFIAHFEGLVEALAALGVSIVNCSRRTALESVPRMTLEEALP